MSHVRVQRLSAGDDEEHGAKHREPGQAVVAKEAVGMPRIESPQHRRRPHDPHDPQRCNRHKPQDHDRAEQPADPVGAVLLNHEEPDENHDGDRHDIRLEQRRHDFETLDGAKHRNGRRDHAVAIEQRRSEDPERNQNRSADGKPCGSAGRTGAPRDERRQGQDAPFALVVRAHDDGDVLDRDDEQQRVDDQRQHAQDVVVRRRHRVRAEETLPHGVQRAGADVAVDDAERGECEGKQTAAVRRSAGEVDNPRISARELVWIPECPRRTYELFMTFGTSSSRFARRQSHLSSMTQAQAGATSKADGQPDAERS